MREELVRWLVEDAGGRVVLAALAIMVGTGFGDRAWRNGAF